MRSCIDIPACPDAFTNFKNNNQTLITWSR